MATHARRKPNPKHSSGERAAADQLLGRISDAMEARAMTKSSLADAIGKARSTVVEWWTKGHLPDAASLMKLPAALGCDGHWLLTGDGMRMRMSTDADGAGHYVLGGGDALARAAQLLHELSLRWRSVDGERVSAERALRDSQLMERIMTPPHRKVRRAAR